MPRSIENWIISSLLKRGSIRTEELMENPHLIRTLPPLIQSLRSYMQGDWGPIISRELETMRGQVPFEFLLQALALADKLDLPVHNINHLPQSTAADNLQVLEQSRESIDQVFGPGHQIQVLKTVTVSFRDSNDNYYHFLVSGFGDFQVEKTLIRQLAGIAGVSYKHRHVNDEAVFDPDIGINMVPGLVKPIILPQYLQNITGICYLHLADPNEIGAVTATLVDSFLTYIGVLEEVLKEYLLNFCQDSRSNLQEVAKFSPDADVYLVNR